ncbi:MAG: FecR domain-containing protein [Gallionella sp.]|nr:FecR domain-containing protein [Gallionella sp.]MDD4947056.1 FecR domain-containing protein [Gallionella sp.]
MSKVNSSIVCGVVLTALFAVDQSVYAEEVPAAADYAYTVKPGDTLSRLTHEVMDGMTPWSKLAQYNKLPNAQLVKPGDVLHIPFPWMKNLPAEAHIEALAGEVVLNGKPASVGDTVTSNAVLKTAQGGSVRLSLPDGSTLNVLENSTVEAKDISRKQQEGFFHTVFKLLAGRIDAIKSKFPPDHSPLLVDGQHGTIGVRGTHFRMGQQGADTLAEIEHGQVAFDAGKRTLALSGGEGSVADGVKAPAVIPLLPAPVLRDVPEFYEQAVVRINLQEMKEAQGFRAEVAREAEFAALISQGTHKGAQLRIADLPNGNYWLRVRAMDKHGLQGLEAHGKFVVKSHPAAPLLMEVDNIELLHGVKPPFNWTAVEEAQGYRFQISRDREFKDLALKQDDLREPQFSLGANLQVGEYYWRVASFSGEVQGPWSEIRKLTVLPAYAPAPAAMFGNDRLVVSWPALAGQSFEYQLAAGKDFSIAGQPQKLAAAKIDIPTPAPGRYLLRVRTVDADGFVNGWEPLRSVNVLAPN